jgi:hypothetical protein
MKDVLLTPEMAPITHSVFDLAAKQQVTSPSHEQEDEGSS